MRIVAFALAWLLLAAPPAAAAEVQPRYGMSIFGDLKYGPDFQHFDYVNPDAPKGGELHMVAIDSFDSVNPFILKGAPADGLDPTFESLMMPSEDEPDSVYSLIAKSVELDPERRFVAFNLRPEARFNDGSRITADDVVFTFNALVKDGDPRYRILYRDVADVVAEGPERVVFRFKETATRDLPILVATMPVLSKAYFQTHVFARTTLEPLLGSGPYRIAKVDPGRSITYERVKDHWARDLPVYRGRFNYGRIRYDYYRDRDVAFEAFFSNQYDFNDVPTAKHWATGYDRPPVRDHLIRREVIPDRTPSGVQAFFFNTRRDRFKDRRVRAALDDAFDFEWTNKNLFYGLYKRTRSMFENSDLAATGLPSPAELKLLEPYRDKVPPEVFTEEYQPPKTDGSGNNRENLRKAQALLHEAGWRIKNGKLVDGQTGRPFTIEFLLFENTFERVIGPYIQNLRRLGIDARMRLVDVATYIRRLQQFDFDVVTQRYTEPLTPGVEQRNYWSSANADIPGSLNLAGIRDPAVDALVEQVIAAKSRPALIAATHALDRVLMWNHVNVPQWYSGTFKIAYWNKFGRPKIQPKYALGFLDTWWVDPAKAKLLADGKAPPPLPPLQ